MARGPALESVGIRERSNGPESFTPDGNFILGAAPECANMYVGAGFNAFGIASAGGAGWALAEWAVRGEAPLDLWVVDIRRFSALHCDRDRVKARTLEAYGKHYTVAFPHEEYATGRNRIVSPLYDRLKAAGAVFGSKLGWERPNWFAPPGTELRDIYSMGRQNWFGPVGDEHRLVRDRAGGFDQSSFAKYEVTGKDAAAALNFIAANNIDKPPGRLTYTQMLNTRGGIECDLTVSRLADDRFYIVTGTGFRTHDLAWIRDHVPAGMDARIEDVTEAFGTLSLMGPRSRETLEAVTPETLDLTFGRVQVVTIAGHQVRALRVTYVGEFGWELHIPIAGLGDAYDALMKAGVGIDLRPGGYRALESLRLEKGYRAWGSDITPNDTPFEAGLGWAVKLKSDIPFIGRDALLALRDQPLKKRLATFTTDREDIVLLGRETLLRNGEAVGYLTSGGYGYTVGKPIGLGYVRHPEPETGSYELVVANERVAAQIHFAPLYDPQNLKVKA